MEIKVLKNCKQEFYKILQHISILFIIMNFLAALHGLQDLSSLTKG